MKNLQIIQTLEIEKNKFLDEKHLDWYVQTYIRNYPEFLEMALKQDAETARSLASLCDSFAQTLSMELDEKNRASLAPTGTEAPAARMRM